ncbi:MAG: glycosyltransferase family 39 protein [Minisyncoccota bacterium]
MSIKNYMEKWRVKYSFLVLIAISLVGIGLRTIHHSDWLVFKSDQARDALIMEQAMINGIISLPLLGSEAGSTGFRLGPISYYFQYVSGKLFGGTPESFAYPDLLFGILTIPFLFLLLRRFLSVPVSLWLTTMASISLLLVTFSRFAWNPNSLPFFTTMFSWFFLSAIEKNGNERRWLLIAAAISLGIIAQLHMVAILGLGIGLILFQIFSKELRLREIIISMMIVITLQAPLFVYEWQTNGSNTKMFLSATTSEKYQDTKHAWYEKTIRAYQQGSRIIWLITTGQQNTDMILTRGLSVKCDQECQEALPYSIASMILFSFIIISNYRHWKSIVVPRQKKALSFIGLWFGGFFLVTILVAYEIETRFYLGLIPPLFIFFGLAIERILNTSHQPRLKYTAIFIGTALILLNLQATTKYLRELAVSQVSAEESSRDLRFGTEAKVTLGQLRAIAKTANQKFVPTTPILISGESHHVKSMYYVLSAEYGYRGCYMRGKQKTIPVGFNHLFINEYRLEEDNDLIPFGTLGATFEITDLPEPSATFPQGCLTY